MSTRITTYVAAEQQRGARAAAELLAALPAVEVEPAPPDVLPSAAPSTAGSSYNWDALGECERPGEGWNENHGPAYEGKLGFAASTWDGWRNGEFAENAGDATREQQIIVAERIAADVGITAWGCWEAAVG